MEGVLKVNFKLSPTHMGIENINVEGMMHNFADELKRKLKVEIMEKMEKEEAEKDDKFIKEYQAQIQKAHTIFLEGTFEAFVGITKVLVELARLRQDKLSPRILRAVIDEGYIKTRETQLASLSEKEGIYIPNGKSGGGDYWLKNARGGEVGEVTLIDAVGHGEAALPLKCLVVRWLELRQQTDPPSENPLVDLDLFMEDLPCLSQIDITRAEIITESKGSVLNIEAAGNIQFFIRHDDGSGYVDYYGSPIAQKGKTETIVTQSVFDSDYIQLGSGFNKGQSRSIKKILLPEKASACLMTDGLFGKKLPDGTDFGSHFVDFCVKNKDLSSDQFFEKLFAVLKGYGRDEGKDDDVTALVIRIGNDSIVSDKDEVGRRLAA